MITLLLMSKSQETEDGRKFRKFFTSVKIVVKGEEEQGLQEKSLTVRFDRNVDSSKFYRGILKVEDADIDIPYKWEIKSKIDKKTGKEKVVYPYVYVRKVASYEERKPQSTAKFDLKDESDTEETEIK